MTRPTAADVARLPPHELTFLAEDLGKEDPPPLDLIEQLSMHESPIVREGAVYGLAPHASVERVRIRLQAIADCDPNAEVRHAAREALEP